MKEMTPHQKTRFRSAHSTAAVSNLLDALYLPRTGVRVGSMFGSRAYFFGRRLFACIRKQGVCLRVGHKRAGRAIAAGVATPFRPHGRTMRGWVEFWPTAPTAEARDLLLRALAYTRTIQKEDAR